MALGAAATVQLTGFWLALACGCSRSCPLMVARADARSAGHGRTTHSTKLVSRWSEPQSPPYPPKAKGAHGDAKNKKKMENRGFEPMTYRMRSDRSTNSLAFSS